MTLKEFLFIIEHGTVISIYDAEADEILYTGSSLIYQEDFDVQPYLKRRVIRLNTSAPDCQIEVVLE